MIKVYCDGSCNNNPGHSAAGVYIETPHYTISRSEYLGFHTVNYAEYSAIILALNLVYEYRKEKIIQLQKHQENHKILVLFFQHYYKLTG